MSIHQVLLKNIPLTPHYISKLLKQISMPKSKVYQFESMRILIKTYRNKETRTKEINNSELVPTAEDSQTHIDKLLKGSSQITCATISSKYPIQRSHWNLDISHENTTHQKDKGYWLCEKDCKTYWSTSKSLPCSLKDECGEVNCRMVYVTVDGRGFKDLCNF